MVHSPDYLGFLLAPTFDFTPERFIIRLAHDRGLMSGMLFYSLKGKWCDDQAFSNGIFFNWDGQTMNVGFVVELESPY